jgi:hypothetical protein
LLILCWLSVQPIAHSQTPIKTPVPPPKTTGTLPPPPKLPKIEGAATPAGTPAEKPAALPAAGSTPAGEADSEESGDEADPEADIKPLPGDAGKDPNPLNPAGDDLDKLIELRINEDLWKQVRGRLPCVEPTQKCIGELQALSVGNAKPLKAIDERLTKIEESIAESVKDNKKSVNFGKFEPILQEWLKYTPENTATKVPESGGLLNNIFRAIARPQGAINQILSLIGLPIAKAAAGGGGDAQTRAISITDLTAKVTTIKAGREEMADKLREKVSEELLAFDDARREFQASKEIAQREELRSRILAVEYRLGKGDTAAYLGYQSALDGKKIDTYRNWSRVRGRLQRLKLLVLGTPDESE